MKKSVALLLCFVILMGCLVSCVDKNDDVTPLKDPYSDVIDKYKEFLGAKNNAEGLTAPDASDEITTALYKVVNSCTDPLAMGYATKDINRDGKDELVLLDEGNKLYALFTVSNNAPVLLVTPEGKASLSPDGNVYLYKYVRDEGECNQIKKIVDGKLEGIEFGFVDNGDSTTYYKIEDGVRSEITYREKQILSESMNLRMSAPEYYIKTVGFRFIPAIAQEPGQNAAPVADFSSYDAIISAYKKVIETLSDFTAEKWTNGEFDDLFTFSDNDSYDVFHSIFFNALTVMPTNTYYGSEYAEDGDNSYGYTKKDLNGDGVEELILLNDNYDIIAVFTMNGDKAVLLKDASGSWIDENGRFHLKKWTGGFTYRDGEVFLYELKDGGLSCVFGVGYNVNVYLEMEGWYKIEGGSKTDISQDEGESLYARYDILPRGWTENEYTRSLAGLEFTPLFERTVADQKHIGKHTNIAIVNGDSLTLSEVSENKVVFTFDCVYVKGDEVIDPEVHETTVIAEATLEGSRYTFQKDGTKGYIEFCVNGIWLVITESGSEYVESRAYLFDYPNDAIG